MKLTNEMVEKARTAAEKAFDADDTFKIRPERIRAALLAVLPNVMEECGATIQRQLDNARGLTSPPGMHYTVAGLELARNTIRRLGRELCT